MMQHTWSVRIVDAPFSPPMEYPTITEARAMYDHYATLGHHVEMYCHVRSVTLVKTTAPFEDEL